MDIGVLAQTVSAAILPWISHLLGKAADKAAEAVGSETGKGAFERARTVWARLVRSDADGKLSAAAHDAADMPGDADAGSALRLRIRRLLDADEQLCTDLAAFFPAGVSANTAIASGAAAVAVGGSADGATISTSAGRAGSSRRP